MDFEEIVRTNRSYRRFREYTKVPLDTLTQLVDLARYTASAANLQPLRYILSCSTEMNERIFETLGWAAYLKDWKGPLPGERPSGYVVILGDKEVAGRIDCDHGIAAQTIMLGAVDRGLGGCILGAVNRKKLQEILELSDQYEINWFWLWASPRRLPLSNPWGLTAASVLS